MANCFCPAKVFGYMPHKLAVNYSASLDHNTLINFVPFFYQSFSVEDTDIDCIRKEIEKTKQVIHDLNNLQHGVVKDPLLRILREVSVHIATERERIVCALWQILHMSCLY